MLLNRLRDNTTGPSRTLEATATTTSSATRSYQAQETTATVVHSASESNPSVTSLRDVYTKDQRVIGRTSSVPSGLHQKVTKGSGTNFLATSVNPPTPILPVLNSKTALPFVSVEDSMRKQEEEQTTSQDLNAPSVPPLKDTLNQDGTTEARLFKNIPPSNAAGSTPAPQTGPWSRPSKSWVSQTESENSLIEEELNNHSTRRALTPQPNSSDHSQTPSSSIFHLQKATNQIFPFNKASSPVPISTSQTPPQDLVHTTHPPTLNSSLGGVQSSLLELLSASSHHQSTYSPSDPTRPPTRAKRTSQNQHGSPTVMTSNPSLQMSHGTPQTLAQSSTPEESFYESTRPPSQTPRPQSFGQKQTQASGTAQNLLSTQVYPPSSLAHGRKVKPATSHIKAESPFAFTQSVAPRSTRDSFLYSTTNTVPATSFHQPRFTTSLNPPGISAAVSKQILFNREPFSPSTTTRNQRNTSPALPALPSPSPISTPPHIPFLQLSSSSSIPVSSVKPPSSSSRYSSSVHIRTTSPTFTTSPPPHSPATIFPTPASSFSSSASSAASRPHSSSIATSVSTASSLSVGSVPTTFSASSSPEPEPSSLPHRSPSQLFTSASSSVSSHRLTKGEGLLIQDPTAPSESQPKLSIPTPTMMVHPNPEPYPNFDPHLKANINKLKPNLLNTGTKSEHPSNPTRTPGEEGKYPDIIPRHSAWELGMLLGCSAGLGMVLVVGLKYMYSQACGKRTEVTLNDREREYARGERGLIHVQECGDLVRVRRIRDNSFVLLAEYDILTSPGD